MASNRKKKEKKKDFTKAKLRVGKTPLKNANFTSTEFKAKKINISSSTKNLVSKSSSTTSSEYLKKFSVVRKTTSNLNSRKEILAEILETLKKDPFQETHLIPLDELIKILKMLFIDQSKKIRTDAKDILAELIKNHNNLIILNIDSLLLFIFSAMTHLKPTIRSDSINLIELIINDEPTNDKLKSLSISNNWVKIWKNLLILMNWKKENKSYIDSNDFKDFNNMRLKQLNFIFELLKIGCFEEKTNNNDEEERTDVIHCHDLLSTYMIKPNNGMIYKNLKLFGNISINTDNSINRDSNNNELVIDDSMICEDLNDRIRVFYEGFYEFVKVGILDYNNVEDLKLVNLSKKILDILDKIKIEYDLVAD